MDGQGTTWRRNIADNFNSLSRAHERYRQTTDRRTGDDIEREREFTFAKMHNQSILHDKLVKAPSKKSTAIILRILQLDLRNVTKSF